MTYSRNTSINPNPYGDTTKQAIEDKLDADLTKIFSDLNAHEALTTGAHGITSTIVGTLETQTLSNKTLSAPITYTDFFNFAKGNVISGLCSIVGGTNYVKGLWVFDTTSGYTVTDRSGSSHPITLCNNSLSGIDASNLTPGFWGAAPYLCFDAATTYYWTTPDSADFTFGNGSVDTPFSVVVLAIPNTGPVGSSQSFAAKFYDPSQNEWLWEWTYNGAADYRLRLNCNDESSANYIAKYSGDNIYADLGGSEPHTYIVTKSSGITPAAINMYRDGVATAGDVSVTGGTYTAMGDSGGAVGNYYTTGSGTTRWRGRLKVSVIMIVGIELTAAQVRQINYLLRSFAGVSL